MNISQIRNLDIGMSGITCSGTIDYCGKAKNITGTRDDGSGYDFWSQFVTIKDSTGKIGASFIVDEFSQLTRNTQVFVDKSTLESYTDKNNKPALKLTVKDWRRTPQNAQQAPQEAAGGANVPQKVSGPQNKDRLIVAQVVYKELAGFFAPVITEEVVGTFDVWFTKGGHNVLKRHVDLIMQIGNNENPAKLDTPEKFDRFAEQENQDQYEGEQATPPDDSIPF